ncbi:hypothetical protein BJY52DRAFT_1417608 [Lactarius psammicola]|nr:hypothetical protein BJY52DRAFT_1417608 [Lactarius psammicola]
MGTQSHYIVFPPSFGEPLLSICFPSGSPFFLPSDSSSGATSHVRKISQGRRKKQKNLCAQGESYRRTTTISMLPDDVLLEIFDFWRRVIFNYYSEWHILVHDESWYLASLSHRY